MLPVDQNRLLPESSFSLGEGKGECEHLTFAALVQKNGMQGPSSERGNELSQNKEIMQQNEKVFAEASFQFHKEYIKKRLRKAASGSVSTKELFEEIQAKGYQGTIRTVQKCVSITNKSSAPEASLEFHKEYIKKRLRGAALRSVSTKQLFKEIQANGYLGADSTVRRFVSMIRTSRPPEASLKFHKGYIKKRLTEAIYVSTAQIFEEIKANGYLGAYNTVKVFVSMMRTSNAPKTSIQFHKDYIKRRLETATFESVSIRQLFKEIKTNGYLGSYDSVRSFVSTIREKKEKGPEASFQFHKEYIKKRLKEAISESVSIKELFEEIKAKGYQGTFRTVEIFVSLTHTSRPPEASLQFHKEYIKKRLRGAASKNLAPLSLPIRGRI